MADPQSPATLPRPRVAVVQDGARLHYAIPLVLHQQGVLERVFCDWFSRPGSLMHAGASLARLVKPALGQRMLDRWEPGLADATVLSNPRLAVQILKRRQRNGLTFESETRIAADIAAWVRRRGFGNANALFGFIRQTDPGLFETARQRGLFTVGDQIIAPYAIERAEEIRQRELFPDFAKQAPSPAEDGWIAYEERTWQALGHITCASDYVRDGLTAQGIVPDKITVNPYPVDTAHFPFVDRIGRKGPVTVGFVGSVNLRKGTPYFWQVAQRFDPEKVRFVMVGPVGIAPAAVEKHRGAVELVGNVPRSEIHRRLAAFDIYFFPSTCEGSAGSVTEAMATGLPIVTSPNSGSIIHHNESGFIFPYQEVDGYAGAIQTLAEDSELRIRMGRAARAQVESTGIDRYGEKLAGLIGQRRDTAAPAGVVK